MEDYRITLKRVREQSLLIALGIILILLGAFLINYNNNLPIPEECYRALCTMVNILPVIATIFILIGMLCIIQAIVNYFRYRRLKSGRSSN